MGLFFKFTWILLLAAFTTAAEDTTNQVQLSGANDKCASYCDKTYTPHTLEKAEMGNRACRQGCRLFSIIQVTNDDSITADREKCNSACAEAFPQTEKRAACNSGCANQDPFTTGRIEIVMDGEESSQLSQFAHSLFDGLFNRIEEMHQNIMNEYRSRFNWPNLGADDNILQSVDKDISGLQNQMSDIPNESQSSQGDVTFNPLYNYGKQIAEQNNNRGQKPLLTHKEFNGKSVGNVDDKGRTILHVAVLVFSGSDGSDESYPMDSSDEKHRESSSSLDVNNDDTWLIAFADRARRLSSVTRWMVCLSLFLCIFSMLWICLAIIRVAPRYRPLYTGVGEIKTAGLPFDEKKYFLETKTLIGIPPPPYYEEEPRYVKADPQI